MCQETVAAGEISLHGTFLSVFNPRRHETVQEIQHPAATKRAQSRSKREPRRRETLVKIHLRKSLESR